MNLILDFTRECNSRCQSCDIWKQRKPVVLDSQHIERLFRQLPSLTEVYVTGGEPFLTEQCVDIARLMRKHQRTAMWTSATNCIAKDTERRIEAIRATGIRVAILVSLEGDEERHDRVRGVSGNYERVLDVINYCRSHSVYVAASCISQEGEDEAHRLGLDGRHTAQRYGERFGDTKGENPSQSIVHCKGGTERIVCTPTGDLYACEVYERPELHIGNIKEQDVSAMKWKEVAETVRAGCLPCSMSCWYNG